MELLIIICGIVDAVLFRKKNVDDDMAAILCLACHGNRLASLYEGAKEFQLFSVGDDLTIYPAGQISLPSRDPLGRASLFCSCGVTFLLCGAITTESRQALQEQGIEVVPWIGGGVEDILEAWCANDFAGCRLPGIK
jgi:hypothetical protein